MAGGPAAIQIAEGPRTVSVPHLQLIDDQTGTRDQVVDRSLDVAAAGDPAVQRMQPALPSAYGLTWRAPVLEEVQDAIGLENPMHFLKGSSHLGNGAERIGAEHAIDRLVGEREARTVDSTCATCAATTAKRGWASCSATAEGSTKKTAVTSAG